MDSTRQALEASQDALLSASTALSKVYRALNTAASLAESVGDVVLEVNTAARIVNQELAKPVDPDPEPLPPEPEPEPLPPEPEPEPEPGFSALSRVKFSVEANKDWRVPQMQASRTGRAPIGTLGDVRRNDWNAGDGDLLKSDLDSVVPEGYAQWSSNLHKKLEVRPGKYTWTNIGVRPGPGARQLKWGTREFNAPTREFVDCDFIEIPREHGLYVSNNGSTFLEGCTFLRCGSQGVQFAHRPLPYQQYDADNLPYKEPPTHVVRDCHFVDNAYKGDRPSFNLTYFNPGTSENPGTILVEDCSFVCDWPEPKYYGGQELRSTGAMVVGNMQGNAPLAGHQMMEAVTLRNCLFDYTLPDREIISLRSCKTIRIEDCAFILRGGSRPIVAIDKYIDSDATKTETIVVKNCHVEGGHMVILLKADPLGKQVRKYVDIHCPGEQITISGRTGEIIQRRTL